MSTVTRSPARSALSTPSPSVTEPSSANLAAPQRAGNAAAQEAAGTTAPPPAGAADLDGALAGLGDLASLVLDVMPLPVAARKAWESADELWARSWLAAQDGAALVREVPDVVAAAFDVIWPLGLGMEIDLAAGLGVDLVAGLKGEMGGTLALERSEAGVHVVFVQRSGLTAKLGVGSTTGGVDGEVCAGVGAGISGSLEEAGEIEWLLAPSQVVEGLERFLPGQVNELFRRRTGLAHHIAQGLLPLLLPLLPLLAARRTELAAGSATAAGGAATVPLAAAAGLEAFAAQGLRLGTNSDGRVFVEARLEAGVSGEFSNWLMNLLHIREVAFDAGRSFAVRVTGSRDALVERHTPDLHFRVSAELSEAEAGVSDALETADIATARTWIARMLSPFDADEAGPGVAAADLPDVSLRRSFDKEVDVYADASLMDATLEAWDVWTDRLPVDFDITGRLEGEIAVPVAAVRLALGGQALAPGSAGIEARVLDVARVIAADVASGARMEVEGLPTLDLEAAATAVEARRFELVTRSALKAAVGTKMAAGGHEASGGAPGAGRGGGASAGGPAAAASGVGEVEGELEGAVTLTRRIDLSGSPRAERARLLEA